MDMHTIEVMGTFLGHLLLGLFLAGWALIWLAEELFGSSRPSEAPLERGPILPALKVTLPLIVAWFELPNSGWPPAHALLGWQHITMYVAFALTGVVDFLVRGGRLPWHAGHVAYAAALLNAGILFLGHGAHGGVPGVAHTLLAILFVAAAGLAVMERARHGVGLEWYRFVSLLALGAWLMTISWVLYRSGWDMADPVREGWTYLLFSWNAIVVAVVLTGARMLRTHLLPSANERSVS